ncbi:MAG: hypothetical protein AAGF11_06580 [Myxococcota bacterium]
MALRSTSWLFVALLLPACGDDEAPSLSSGNNGSTTSSLPTTGGTGLADSSSTSVVDPSVDSSTGPMASSDGMVDASSSGSDSGSTGPSGSSSSGPNGSSTGDGSSSSGDPPSTNGCADGLREALLDEATYPDIAACAGGWMFPGVLVNTAMCNREGGDDGINPAGMGCSIEDLCGNGWHVCESQDEVLADGIADCDAVFWGGAFFATRQSGQGADTCNVNGLNDVFGCGDLGYAMINGCAPLNRSTANLCGELPDPWACDGDVASEADQLIKPAPEFGGALCCRD